MDAAERRARLARRHGLAPGSTCADPLEATRRVVCLHATDPATVFLSVWARVRGGMRVEDVERALYEDRSLVKHLAMRRTLFVFAVPTLPAAQAGASARVADRETKRLVRDVERAGLVPDGANWLRQAGDAVLERLADGSQASMAQLREEIPLLAGSIMYAEGKPWGGLAPVGPRVLTTLSAGGLLVRAGNEGGWTTSRPRWAAMARWVGRDVLGMSEAEGTAALVSLWLRAFGPGTADDISWWLGTTKAAVAKALTSVAAVQVDLGGPTVGYVLPDDLDEEEPVDPWAALLPSLDPTVMGWADREFYLGEHRPAVFDRNGNAGPTAWWDGRIVGGWRQDERGQVVLQIIEDVGPHGRACLQQEAERLTAWLGGTRISPRFPSPLFRP